MRTLGSFTQLVSLDKIEFCRRVYRKTLQTEVFSRSASVAFYFSFAFFPLLFFLITVFGLILESTDNLRNELYHYLIQIMPASAYELVRKTLDEIIETSTGGKLTLGLFITLWSASAGAGSLRKALNAVYELRETRSWWRTKLQSLLLTLLFISLIAFSLAVVTAGWNAIEAIIGRLGIAVTTGWLLAFIEWLTTIIALLFTTFVIYSWVPNFRRLRWLWISPGAVVAIILWIAFTSGFRLYLQYFNSYNRTYGSLGAVIILMLWMYLSAVAILIGGVINSVLHEMEDEN
ncbi:MAG TPA: YihY/virulence factor BrkB family protein [Pyrinomonadaceae bacterium]|nr:YihY/virulence factor BrkB family protein [Pyrinomonadaceae bacterium]